MAHSRAQVITLASLQAREIVEDIGLDNVTIHLDTYHMNIEENSMEQAVAAAGDKLGCALHTQARPS